MEVSGIGGPKAVDPAAARMPAPRRNAVEGGNLVQLDEGSDNSKEKVQRENQPRQVELVSTRSGTRTRIDEESKRIIFQILGGDKQVIKQIPPEELLRLSARMKDLQQQLFDEQV
jgi:uncharacterized FlaG/YvyC family protein